MVKLSERTFSVRDHLVVPVRQQIRAESINLMTIPQLFLLPELRVELHHPHGKVGVEDVEVVGDAPHQY